MIFVETAFLWSWIVFIVTVLIDWVHFFINLVILARILELSLRGIGAFIEALPEGVSPHEVFIEIGLTEEGLSESHLLAEDIFVDGLFSGLTNVIDVFFMELMLFDAFVCVLVGFFEVFNLEEQFVDEMVFLFDDLFEWHFLFDFPFEFVLWGSVKSFGLFELLDDDGFLFDKGVELV